LARPVSHRISSLPIEEQALTHLAKLPPLHRDPFDRILVAQVLQHGLTMVTVDDVVKAYPIKVLAA
jgi:PIN domain nuclease of toxin-antitoxin system